MADTNLSRILEELAVLKVEVVEEIAALRSDLAVLIDHQEGLKKKSKMLKRLIVPSSLASPAWRRGGRSGTKNTKHPPSTETTADSSKRPHS